VHESKPAVIDRNLFIDDRGGVYGAFDNMDKVGIKRTYVVENFAPRFVRAWHGHRRAATFMHVINGAAKLAAVNMDDHSDFLITTLTATKPGLLYVPPGYFNGSMTLVPGTKLLVYSTLTLEECKSDDVRANYKDIKPEIWDVVQR
jgi:dTDP-4-dehydrorhamnose 3,5-epimerase-like enzyme